MSFFEPDELLKPDWGIEDSDFEAIMRKEKLVEVTSQFQGLISTVLERFGSKRTIRVFAYNERSGHDNESNTGFRSYKMAHRDLFCNLALCNRDLCAVFVTADKGVETLKTTPRAMYHEYAHHFQLADAGFPWFIPNGPNSDEPKGHFARTERVGPYSGKILINGSHLPYETAPFNFDYLERTSDLVCEGLIREKCGDTDLLDHFQRDWSENRDPGLAYPRQDIAGRTYARRLGLRDAAESEALLRIAYPSKDIKAIMSSAKAVVFRNNKDFKTAQNAYTRIAELCLKTNFKLFSEKSNVVTYNKKVLDHLGIKIETQDDW